MAGSISKFVERMRYWCDHGDLGYDQWQRWDIREGGECDCSSLVIHSLREAGFDTGSATYTGDLRENLTARGWVVVDPDGNPHVGDILLNDGRHVAACTGVGLLSQASIDENGRAHGGASGDQTDHETNTRGYYDYPWDCYLRFVGEQSATSDSRSVDDLAAAVLRGEFGDGDDRRVALGDRYDEVQAKVNEICNGGSSSGASAASTDDLAAAVLRGEYGNGDERRAALGNRYDEVQARVNELCGFGGGNDATVDDLAAAVIRGEYGNGDERRQALGDRYEAVQRRVNELLS
jgi:hypothetical protein